MHGAARFYVRCALLGLALYCAARPAQAEIQRTFALSEILKTSTAVVQARVVGCDGQDLRVALQVFQTLQGKLPFTWMDVDVSHAGWMDPDTLFSRVKPGLIVLCFISKVHDRYVALLFTDGSWFQFSAPDTAEDKERLDWTFTRADPYLHRTFGGKTVELDHIIQDVVAGNRQPPAPNPGGAVTLGPETPGDFLSNQPLPALPASFAARYAHPGSAPKPDSAVPAPDAADADKALLTVPIADRPQLQQMADEFKQPLSTVIALYHQANGNAKDVRWALSLVPNYGQGGERALVRTPQEILRMKQQHDRLTWLDIRGCLIRAGDLFRPVQDPAQLLADLRQKFTWAELDPLLQKDKYEDQSMDAILAKWTKERLTAPLLPGQRLFSELYTADFGSPAAGGAGMEEIGWARLPGSPANLARRQYAWNGADMTSTQAPGKTILHVPDCVRWDRLDVISNLVGYVSDPEPVHGDIPSSPPAPGLPLADNQGVYKGASLWLANGIGDYQGQGADPNGAIACYKAGWIAVPHGRTRSFLMDLQVYVPDHTEQVGETRPGSLRGREPARAVAVGVRIADAKTHTVGIGPPLLNVNVEPAVDRFDRILVRIDITPTQITLIAFLPGVGEVARATATVAPGDSIGLAPLVGIGRPGQGYVPEFYLAGLKVSPIDPTHL